MKEMKANTYSNNDIEKAGRIFLNEKVSPDDFSWAMDVWSFWRYSHEKPLGIAFSLIQKEGLAIDKKCIFAKRLKRYISIVNKLKRFESMNLRNVQDIGGCRIVVNSSKKLNKIVKSLKKRSEFQGFDWKIRFKDYIAKPKLDWYRCYHLIWRFWTSAEARNIEIQIRNNLQHSWATALEIVDLFTRQSLKHNAWEKDWSIFFQSVSKLFALIESIHMFQFNDSRCQKLFIDWINLNEEFKEAAKSVKQLSKKLKIEDRFNAFASSLKIIDEKILSDKSSGYLLIEIDIRKWSLNARLFDNNNVILAEQEYTKLEKQAIDNNDTIIALVSTDSLWDIRDAYPNYFADSTEFIKHLVFILRLIPTSFWDIF